MESLTSMFHGWNTWCPHSLDILSPCPPLHPLDTKLFYVTTLTLKAESCWHSLYLSVSFKPKEKKTFSLLEVCCAIGRRWCGVWHFFFFYKFVHVVSLTLTHLHDISTFPHFIFTVYLLGLYCLLSTSWLKAFAWPFIKLIFLEIRIGWVGPNSASISISHSLYIKGLTFVFS